MGLAEEIEASSKTLYRRFSSNTCMVKLLLDALSVEDRSSLEQLLSDHRVFSTSIAGLLHGWADKLEKSVEAEKNQKKVHDLLCLAQLCADISDRSIQRHRRNQCLCSRKET
jgi:hypothetical protein